jgi:hypothetical protein
MHEALKDATGAGRCDFALSIDELLPVNRAVPGVQKVPQPNFNMQSK